jgi:hypothetical protein
MIFFSIGVLANYVQEEGNDDMKDRMVEGSYNPNSGIFLKSSLAFTSFIVGPADKKS